MCDECCDRGPDRDHEKPMQAVKAHARTYRGLNVAARELMQARDRSMAAEE